MKHAYLIIAHNEFTLLKLLINALDDKRNDIFIHFDKKVAVVPQLLVKHAGLFQTKERIDVRWGNISVVEAEYVLFDEAVKSEKYAYYHLISGVDIPLKGQNEIHDFFLANQGKEFIGFSQYNYRAEVERKAHKYHLFPRDFRFNNDIMSLIKKGLRFLFLYIQDAFRFQRHKDISFKKGTQWVSVTHDFVEYILAERQAVMKRYRYTFCCDELYKQTLCWNSPFKASIYDFNNEEKGCMRKIGWTNGKLTDWKMDDFEKLIKSTCVFARKFGSADIDIVKKYLRL
jgi:Core-2/I-Branching enzyme.